MDAELLENAAAAARILGISVPKGLLRRAAGALLDAPAWQAGGALEAAVRDAGAAAKRASAAESGVQWLAEAVESAAESGGSQRVGAGSGGQSDLPRRVQLSGGIGLVCPAESDEMARGAYQLSRQTTKTDMAAVSRCFERDARRYGQEGWTC